MNSKIQSSQFTKLQTNHKLTEGKLRTSVSLPQTSFNTDTVIGLEIHVELNVNTKLFCSCARTGNDTPNSRVCQVCLGHPGSKPTLNKKVLDHAIKLCLALNCTLDHELIFSRKSYFYPDMSKNYQITQFERPLGFAGSLKLNEKIINIKRVHIEEDPASISYPESMQSSKYSLIDYNRCGNSLLEIVTEPELETPKQAREFLNKLISILSYLKIFDINACIIKADANVSIKESNYTRVEIKNITGFKELERALTYEIMRQKTQLRMKREIKTETRGWDPNSKTTKLQRSKESEDDYGYIIEPDLTITDVNEELVKLLKKEIPELAHQKSERFIKQYNIDPIDAEVMTLEFELAELFEKVAKEINPSLAAKWLRRELLRVLNYNKKTVRDIKFDEKELIELLSLVETKTITDTTAQRIMEQLIENTFSPKKYVEEKGLSQLTDLSEIKKHCEKVIKENQKAVDDYKNGEAKAVQYLIGQVMKLTKGKANPEVVNGVMKKLVGK